MPQNTFLITYTYGKFLVFLDLAQIIILNLKTAMHKVLNNVLN